MTGEYESANVQDLYFAGALVHGKDYKRAAGGFVHGFRYAARALARILAHKNHHEAWQDDQRQYVLQGAELHTSGVAA